VTACPWAYYVLYPCCPPPAPWKLPREYGSTGVREYGSTADGDMDTSNGCLWSLTSWQAKYFWPFPCVANVAFMVIVAHVGRMSLLVLLAPGSRFLHPWRSITHATHPLSRHCHGCLWFRPPMRREYNALFEFFFAHFPFICVKQFASLKCSQGAKMYDSRKTGKYYNIVRNVCCSHAHSICREMRMRPRKSWYTRKW